MTHENIMYRTERRETADGTWLEAEFGLHVIGSQEPYMSLTAVEFSHPSSRLDRHWLACGQLRELTLATFPELADVAKFHLCADGEPMHYMANARFWFEGVNYLRQRSAEPDMRAAFASTICWGVLGCWGCDALANRGSLPLLLREDDDTLTWLLSRSWSDVKVVLEARMPFLQGAFRAVVATLPELAAATNAERI